MDNLHWLSKQAITMVFRYALEAHPAIGIKLFTMALNNCAADEWRLYFSNELLGLYAFDRQMRQLIIRAIETLKEYK